jgi:hypothetical protein
MLGIVAFSRSLALKARRVTNPGQRPGEAFAKMFAALKGRRRLRPYRARNHPAISQTQGVALG